MFTRRLMRIISPYTIVPTYHLRVVQYNDNQDLYRDELTEEFLDEAFNEGRFETEFILNLNGIPISQCGNPSDNSIWTYHIQTPGYDPNQWYYKYDKLGKYLYQYHTVGGIAHIPAYHVCFIDKDNYIGIPASRLMLIDAQA